LTSELDIADALSSRVMAEFETDRASEVLGVRVSNSAVFGDCAKTTEIEFGSRRPNEISSEFQRIFIKISGFLAIAKRILLQEFCSTPGGVLSLGRG
jgi:hypothetical protein